MEKRKWDVGAIVLPAPRHHSPPLEPLEKGDRLLPHFRSLLIRASPQTHSYASLKGKNLALHIVMEGEGTLLCCFPDLSPLSLLKTGRLHLPVLVPKVARVHQAYIGKHSILTPLQGLTTTGQLSALLPEDPLPVLWGIDSLGHVLAVCKGYYLNSENIAKVMNQRRQQANHQENPPYLP